MDLGPLKTLTEDGILVGGGCDSVALTKAPGWCLVAGEELLVVKVGETIFRYQPGCIEEARAIQMHDEVFSKFSKYSEAEGTLLMGFIEFANYACACGQQAEWDVFEAVCKAIQVHTSQGLTAGDFRRIYCEFEGDVEEDLMLATGRAKASQLSQLDQVTPELITNKAVKAAPLNPDALEAQALMQPKDRNNRNALKTLGVDDLSVALGSRSSDKRTGGTAHKPCPLVKGTLVKDKVSL